jgi:hypothetical protein
VSISAIKAKLCIAAAAVVFDLRCFYFEVLREGVLVWAE